MARVLVVEDDASMRDILAGFIANCAELQFDRVAATVAEAVQCRKERASHIDVLLNNLGLPDASGLDVIRLAIQLNPSYQPHVLSSFGDDVSWRQAIRTCGLNCAECVRRISALESIGVRQKIGERHSFHSGVQNQYGSA